MFVVGVIDSVGLKLQVVCSLMVNKSGHEPIFKCGVIRNKQPIGGGRIAALVLARQPINEPLVVCSSSILEP